MPVGNELGRFDHHPRTQYPAPYHEHPPPEPTYKVTLGCNCVRRFPLPLPRVGDGVTCPTHSTPTRVTAAESPPPPRNRWSDRETTEPSPSPR